MFRFRLASLSLAFGLLITLAGCTNNMCGDSCGMGGMGGGRMFGRLFNSQYHPMVVNGGHECECQTPAGMPGPIISSSPNFPPQPIPITTVPSNGPPQIFKVPQAQSTPYFPAQ